MKTHIWYVAFEDVEPKHPSTTRWGKFLDFLYRGIGREGFRHVFCFAQWPVGGLQMHVSRFGLRPFFLFNKDGSPFCCENYALGLAYEGRKVLRIELPVEEVDMRRVANCIPSCVTLIKVTLGIKSWAVSPYGLYKDLLKAGALEFTEEVCNEIREKKVEELCNG